MNTTDSSIGQIQETDIVVIGGGGAGLAAAVAAAEKGAGVTLFEKRALGGNTAMARGVLAVESRLQKKLDMHVSRDEAFKIAMEYSHWKINPRILRVFLDRSAETLDWLESMDLSFERIEHVYGNSLPTMHSMNISKRGGADIVDALHRKCDELGVQIFLHSPIKKILTDSPGQPVGVLAEMNNQDYEIQCRSIIIATGGYGGSKELMRKYFPQYSEHAKYIGVPVTGDGLVMAMDIGAAMDGLGTVMVHHQIYHGAMALNLLIRDPAALWVNKKGVRFTDEGITRRSVECGNILSRQPDSCVFIIMDSSLKNRLTEDFIKNPPKGGAFRSVNEKTDLDALLQKEMDKGGVMVSPSWDDIAGWIGVQPDVLKTTVKEYNTCCEQGYDPVFNTNKENLLPLASPPYYALKCHMHYLTTMGGIKINHHMEILNQQDDPIRGLYASGDCAGGLEGDSYCMVLASSGMGWALNSGRMAGENAAKYIATA